jgi:hypothetical protein
MSFKPCNCPLKIWESIGIPNPKVGIHLGVWGFIPSTFLHSREHETWLPGSLLARSFTSLYFGREPKAKVATITFQKKTLVPIYNYYMCNNHIRNAKLLFPHDIYLTPITTIQFMTILTIRFQNQPSLKYQVVFKLYPKHVPILK